MSDQAPTPAPPSFGDRLALAFIKFVRALVRIVLILLLAVLLGAGVYYGAPALYRRYVQPVETNLARLNDAQSRQEQANQQINQRLDELGQRLQDLELQNDSHKQTLDEVQARLDEMERAQKSDEQAGGSLQATEIARQEEVEATLVAMGANLEQVQSEVAAINEAMGQTSLQVQELVHSAEAGESPLQELRNELQLVKAMELLTRSRVYLVEDNLGLAQQDVSAARLLLAKMGGDVPSYQVKPLAAIIARLDAALGNLPSRPILAAEDLEVAWQLLRDGLPGEATPQPTPTTGTVTPAALSVTETPTPTPTPIP
jgi:septal ring factor EnvC (AmiA/AmiB activator)